MQLMLLAAKTYGCTLAATLSDFLGSIKFDEALMDAAQILPYGQVKVMNLSNSERFIPFTIVAPAWSGALEYNGAVTRSGIRGDHLIRMGSRQLSLKDLKSYLPTTVLVNQQDCLFDICRDDKLLTEAY
jgi:aspartate 1-decarboxylase